MVLYEDKIWKIWGKGRITQLKQSFVLTKIRVSFLKLHISVCNSLILFFWSVEEAVCWIAGCQPVLEDKNLSLLGSRAAGTKQSVSVVMRPHGSQSDTAVICPLLTSTMPEGLSLKLWLTLRQDVKHVTKVMSWCSGYFAMHGHNRQVLVWQLLWRIYIVGEWWWARTGTLISPPVVLNDHCDSGWPWFGGNVEPTCHFTAVTAKRHLRRLLNAKSESCEKDHHSHMVWKFPTLRRAYWKTRESGYMPRVSVCAFKARLNTAGRHPEKNQMTHHNIWVTNCNSDLWGCSD